MCVRSHALVFNKIWGSVVQLYLPSPLYHPALDRLRVSADRGTPPSSLNTVLCHNLFKAAEHSEVSDSSSDAGVSISVYKPLFAPDSDLG